jgi:hypothetical protein
MDVDVNQSRRDDAASRVDNFCADFFRSCVKLVWRVHSFNASIGRDQNIAQRIQLLCSVNQAPAANKNRTGSMWIASA